MSKFGAIADLFQYKDAAVFVEFLGWFRSGDTIFLAMEYMPHGDLEHNLRVIEDMPAHQGPALPEEEVQEITRQILEGLQIMHSEHFAHRDLKPAVRHLNRMSQRP